MEKDCDILLVKLDIEKTRLLVWGSSVGMLDALTELRHSSLESAASVELLHKCLKNIHSLLTDTNRLTRDYGVVQQSDADDRQVDFVSHNSMALFRTTWRRFMVRNASALPNHNLLSKTKWAIYKRETFQRLINDLKDLVDGLYEIAPVARETLDHTVHADIECLTSLDQLRLVEEATEDSYRDWSAVAGSIINSSEVDTLDRRNLEEQMMDDNLASFRLAESDRMVELINEIKGVSHDPFIVLTRPCLRLESIDHCDVDTIARECLAKSYNLLPFSHAAAYDTRGSLPRLLDATLNLKNKLIDRLDEIGARNSFSIWDDLSDEHKLAKTIFPLARTFIYCAPCICSIQTAIHVCNRVSSTIHEYFIRPDDRLTSSCYSGQNGFARLKSIHGAVRYHEGNAKAPLDHEVPTGTRYIDMIWLEKRFDRMEYEDEAPEHLYQSSDEISRAVLLGELEHLRPITQQMTSARVPKEAEIWQLHISHNAQRWSQKYVGQFATNTTFSVLPTEHPQFSVNSVDIEQSTALATSSPSSLLSGM